MSRLSASIAIIWMLAFWPAACLFAQASNCEASRVLPPLFMQSASCKADMVALKTGRPLADHAEIAFATRFASMR